jgi:hypothetical protein
VKNEWLFDFCAKRAESNLSYILEDKTKALFLKLHMRLFHEKCKFTAPFLR